MPPPRSPSPEPQPSSPSSSHLSPALSASSADGLLRPGVLNLGSTLPSRDCRSNPPMERGTEEVPCKGLQLVFPLGENHHIGYPFGLHSHRSLPWDYYSEGDRFYLRSTTCSKTTSADSAICSKCNKIRNNDIFKNIVDRIAHGVNENTLLMYYPIGGLVTKIRR
ncbi:hypothetical protein B0H16DRAFT_1809028 [Mycena metata]|uniref:Uncharacterized protein n=1 Tax=Mycena metata TaxID=1033252 RepID=A0AAD7H8D3_9AGAR|nr:hypothetical protein B0H16DRAFT_1809028 [Mycena metata]